MISYRKELVFEVPTRRAFINITPQVTECLRASGVTEGLVLVNAMHITASVFINDAESGLLEGLLLAPIGRSTLYYARVTSTFLFIVSLQVVLLVLFLVLFNQRLEGDGLWGLIAATLATDVGFVTIGVMISAMTWSLPGGDVMLRILLFPMLLPIFNVAVEIADRAFEGQAPTTKHLGMLFAIDVMFLGAGHLLFEHLVKDSGGRS